MVGDTMISMFFRKRSLITAALVLLCLSQLAMAARSNTEKIESAVKNGDIEQARELVRAQITPDAKTNINARTENVIGWVSFTIGRHDEAELYLKESLSSSIESGDIDTAKIAANNLGILYFSNDALDESMYYFSRSYNRETPIAMQYRALIEKKRNELIAVSALERGVQQRLNRDFEKAIISYNTALEHKPDDDEAIEYKGYALFRMGKYDEAIEALNLSKRINPERKFVHLNLAKVYCSMGDESGVIKTINDSGVPESQFAEWRAVDKEFSRVCRDSQVIQSLTTRSESEIK